MKSKETEHDISEVCFRKRNNMGNVNLSTEVIFT